MSVTLYNNNDYDGARTTVGRGNYPNASSAGIENDKIGSVRIPAGKKLILYQHNNYRGQSLELDNCTWRDSSNSCTASGTMSRKLNTYRCPNENCGNDDWDDVTSSLKVFDPLQDYYERCASGNKFLESRCSKWCTDFPTDCENKKIAYCRGDTIKNLNCQNFYNAAPNKSPYEQAWYAYCSKGTNFLNQDCFDHIRNNPNTSKRTQFDTLWTNYCNDTTAQGADIMVRYSELTAQKDAIERGLADNQQRYESGEYDRQIRELQATIAALENPTQGTDIDITELTQRRQELTEVQQELAVTRAQIERLEPINQEIEQLRETAHIDSSGEVRYFMDPKCSCFDTDPRWAGAAHCFHPRCLSGEAYIPRRMEQSECNVTLCQNILDFTASGNIEAAGNFDIRNQCGAMGVDVPSEPPAPPPTPTEPTPGALPPGIPITPIPDEITPTPTTPPFQPTPTTPPSQPTEKKSNIGFIVAGIGLLLLILGVAGSMLGSGTIKTLSYIGIGIGLIMFFWGIYLYFSGKNQSTTETFQDEENENIEKEAVTLTTSITKEPGQLEVTREITADSGTEAEEDDSITETTIKVSDIMNVDSEEPQNYNIRIGKLYLGLCKECSSLCTDLLCPKYDTTTPDTSFQIEPIGRIGNSVAIKSTLTGKYLSLCQNCFSSCENTICANGTNSSYGLSQFTLMDNGDGTVSFLAANGRFLQYMNRDLYPGCFSKCSGTGFVACNGLKVDDSSKFIIQQ